MMIKVWDNILQGSKEWLTLRLDRITASNAYKLLKGGVNSAVNKPTEDKTGFWGERGHILEKEAIEIYEQVTGDKVEEIGFMTNTKFKDCGYSPDGMAKRLIEVKCFKKEKHLECFKETPIEVYCQCQFGMMIAEEKEIDLVLYNPDIEDSKLCFKIINIKLDNKLIKRFKEKLNGKKGSRASKN